MWKTRLASAAVITGIVMWTPSGRADRFLPRLVAIDESGGGDATLAPDGRRFVTTSRRSGDWELWIYDIDAARWSRVTHAPGEDFEAKFSPDGTQLVYTSSRTGQKDIWTRDLRTGQERRLTSSPDDDEYPVWSPDGNTIVYTGGPWNARHFFAVPAAGGAPRAITRTPGRAGACGFEPGGQTLVCHRYDEGSGDVIRLWLKDGEIAPLTTGSGWDYKPAASPDGKWIAFSRSVETPSHIWMMPAAGGRPWPITDGPGDDRWPTWSADSKRLLFHRAVEQSRGVERMAGDAGRAQVIVPPGEQPLQASQHPRDGRVAYCAETPSGRRVRIRNVIAGTSIDADTGGRQSCYPRWSPDGSRLALVVRTDERWDVAVGDSAGRNVRLLTANRADLRGMDGPLDWSPDSQQLVFHADTIPFEARLYTVHLASGEINAITGPGHFDESPSWTPDGRSILFMSTRGGNWTWGLFRLSLKDGGIAPFVKPDWTEKNHPRASSNGSIAWDVVNDEGNGSLVEQRPNRDARVLEPAGKGARWPEYSSGGAGLIYTRVEHRVEFWIVDNPAGNGNPPLLTPAVARAAEPSPPHAHDGGSSPRTFHRR